jgi:hypothetical protein
MSNDECPRSATPWVEPHSVFVLRHSFVIGISAFVIPLAEGRGVLTQIKNRRDYSYRHWTAGRVLNKFDDQTSKFWGCEMLHKTLAAEKCEC